MKHLIKVILLVAFIITSAFPLAIVHADEPAIGSPEDNACNPSGVMDGKCDTDWEWGCGYYLARWLSAGGWSGTYHMIADCVSLLPPVPPQVNIAQAAAILEICKPAVVGATATFCFRPNQQGDYDISNNGTINTSYFGITTNNLGDCPAPWFAGHPNLIPAITPRTFFELGGFQPAFTTAELDSVGLNPFLCAYRP